MWGVFGKGCRSRGTVQGGAELGGGYKTWGSQSRGKAGAGGVRAGERQRWWGTEQGRRGATLPLLDLVQGEVVEAHGQSADDLQAGPCKT